MTVLGFLGWEILKIQYISKGQYIDNIQSHNFYPANQDNYPFTLESDTTYKPIQQEWFSLSDPAALDMFSLFGTVFCALFWYLLWKYRKIMLHAVTLSRVRNCFTYRWMLFTQQWPFFTRQSSTMFLLSSK